MMSMRMPRLRIIEGVVPPGEASLVGPPAGRVEVDETGIENASPDLALRGGGVGKTDEGVGVEDVAIGRGHVGTTGVDHVAFATQSRAGAPGPRERPTVSRDVLAFALPCPRSVDLPEC
jgi:hypothetical protein